LIKKNTQKQDGFLSFAWDNLPTRDRLKLLQREKKTVWLFGAGASHHYNLNTCGVKVPLAKGFFEALHALPTSKGFHAHIGPLLSYLHIYRGVHPSKASEWTENIEDFMTSIESEIEELRKKKINDTMTDEELHKVISLSTTFNNMIFLFANVINEAQDGPSYSAYSELLKFCGPNDTFITFNWDTLLDKALASTGAWIPNGGYGIEFSATFDGVWKDKVCCSQPSPCNWKLLKLHGSTNWLVPYTGINLDTYEVKSLIGMNNKVFLFWQGSLPFETFKGRWRGGYGPTCYGYYPPNLPCCFFPEDSLESKDRVIVMSGFKGIFAPFNEPLVQGVPSSPLLVIPVRQKRYDDYIGTIEHLWKTAEKAFMDADRIVVIGYSFPSTDKRALQLLSTTLNNRKKQIDLTLVDPWSDSVALQIEKKNLDLAKTLSLHNIGFEAYIEKLWDQAPQLMTQSAKDNREVADWLDRLQAFCNVSSKT